LKFFLPFILLQLKKCFDEKFFCMGNKCAEFFFKKKKLMSKFGIQVDSNLMWRL